MRLHTRHTQHGTRQGPADTSFCYQARQASQAAERVSMTRQLAMLPVLVNRFEQLAEFRRGQPLVGFCLRLLGRLVRCQSQTSVA